MQAEIMFLSDCTSCIGQGETYRVWEASSLCKGLKRSTAMSLLVRVVLSPRERFSNAGRK